jgi:hypothetical protein
VGGAGATAAILFMLANVQIAIVDLLTEGAAMQWLLLT